MKIRELYTDESKWTRYTEARNYEGDEISLNHPLAVSFFFIIPFINTHVDFVCYFGKYTLARFCIWIALPDGSNETVGYLSSLSWPILAHILIPILVRRNRVEKVRIAPKDHRTNGRSYLEMSTTK